MRFTKTESKIWVKDAHFLSFSAFFFLLFFIKRGCENNAIAIAISERKTKRKWWKGMYVCKCFVMICMKVLILFEKKTNISKMSIFLLWSVKHKILAYFRASIIHYHKSFVVVVVVVWILIFRHILVVKNIEAPVYTNDILHHTHIHTITIYTILFQNILI